MRWRHLFYIALGLALGGALAVVAFRKPDEPSTGIAETPAKLLIGGPFKLIDQTGKAVTDADFKGRPMIVFFGFTHCPDICPSGLQVLSAALDKLGERAAPAVPVFITLDPERDTADVLSGYIKSFNSRLVGLTGSRADIDQVAKSYRVYHQKVASETTPGDYAVDHSAIFYVMDSNGTYVNAIPHTTNVDELTAALDKALPR